MQTKITNDGGTAVVEVVDPSDGAITHTASVADGEQIVVTATTAHSPADIEFGEVEATPEPEAEAAEAGEQAEGEQAAAGDVESGVEQPSGAAEGAEAPADGQGTPAEGDGGECA